MKKPTHTSESGFAEEGQASYAIGPHRLLGSLTEDQRAELEAAIAEADRGDVVDPADVFPRLARKHGLTLDE